MASGSEVRAGGAFVEFFTKGDEAVRKKLAEMQGVMTNFANTTMRYAAVIFAAGMGIAAPLNRGIDSLVARSNELYEANRRTGTSVEDLQALAYATQSTFEATENGIRGITRTMQAAIADPASEAARQLRLLGLTVEELQGMTDPQRVQAFATGLQRVGNAAQRAELQSQVGLGSLNLEGGGTGISQRINQGRSLGAIVSADDVAAAREFNRVMIDFREVVGSVWNTVGRAVIPAATRLFSIITIGVQYVRNFLNENQRLLQIVDGLSGALMVGGVALFGIAGAAMATSVAIGILGTVIAATVATIEFLVSAPGLILIAVLAAIAGAVYLLYRNWDEFNESLGFIATWSAVIESFAATAVQSIGAIGDALSANQWEMAVEIAWTAIQLIWAQGINWIRDAWFGFTYLFDNALDEMMVSFGRTMISIVATAAREINRLIDMMPESVRTRLGIERVNFDEGAANRALDATASGRERERTAAHNAERDRARDEEGALQSRLDELETEAFIIAEQRRLQGTGGDLASVPNTVQNMREQATAVGTFSAEAVRGMDSGPMDRIADNTRATRDAVLTAVEVLRATPLLTMG